MEPFAIKRSKNRAHAQSFAAGEAGSASAGARQIIATAVHIAPRLVISSLHFEALERDAHEGRIEHKIETRQL